MSDPRTITLSEETYARVAAVAERRGMTVERLVAFVLVGTETYTPRRADPRAPEFTADTCAECGAARPKYKQWFYLRDEDGRRSRVLCPPCAPEDATRARRDRNRTNLLRNMEQLK